MESYFTHFFNTRRILLTPLLHSVNGMYVRCLFFKTVLLSEIKGKIFPVIALKAYRGSRSIAPLILNLVPRRRWMATEPSVRYILFN
jgi:hypothetical protein